MEAEEHNDRLIDVVKNYLQQLKEWVKINPADPWYLKIFKTIYKSIVLLILLALSPVLLVVLLFVFFAAL